MFRFKDFFVCDSLALENSLQKTGCSLTYFQEYISKDTMKVSLRVSPEVHRSQKIKCACLFVSLAEDEPFSWACYYIHYLLFES